VPFSVIVLLSQNKPREGQNQLYRLPGLSVRATSYVVDLVCDEFADWDCGRGRPRVISVVDALRLTLCRLRRNSTYEELSEDYGIGVATVWDYVQAMTAFLASELGCSDELYLRAAVAGKVCLVDGTLVPTFNWRHRCDLYSGKHRRHGVNIQVIADIHGRIIGVSQAFPGSRHDSWCWEHAEFSFIIADSCGAFGDAGYQGADELTTPIKKKPNLERHEHDIAFNTQVAKIRVGVEWAIGHLKNWRILATRYRSDLRNIDQDIQAAVGLEMLNQQFSERQLWQALNKTGFPLGNRFSKL
jgi:hypothetical protein